MIVVDTNILFGWFWRDSANRDILLSESERLHTPQYAIKELVKHKGVICRKAKITDVQFTKLLRSLQDTLQIHPRTEYEIYLEKAEKNSPDENDVDFLALCLSLNAVLWTHDAKLSNQTVVATISTEELIRLLY